MPKRKDAFISQLRVPSELSERIQRAMEKLQYDMPHLRRTYWELFCEMAERGEQLSWPPQIVTEKMHVHLLDALEANGIASPTAFFDGCTDALIAEFRVDRKIKWPPKFEPRVDAGN